jgi:hypothetical protein
MGQPVESSKEQPCASKLLSMHMHTRYCVLKCGQREGEADVYACVCVCVCVCVPCVCTLCDMHGRANVRMRCDITDNLPAVCADVQGFLGRPETPAAWLLWC